ncbi:MAG: DNA replication/repair protein RecF [Evtepia sp.]
MNVTSLSLTGFRNYDHFSAAFSPGRNLICGDNAQGKTNLLEAIAFLSGAKSHRTRTERELIGFSQSEALISAQIENRDRDFLVEITLSKHARRKLLVNHVRLKTASALSDVIHTVLFCPEDLALLRDGAAVRRRFLDTSICQLRPKYAAALSKYNKLLEHKSRILRECDRQADLLHVLPEFNDGLARAGAILIHYRAYFIQKLSTAAAHIAHDFSGEQLILRYETVKTISDPFASPLTLYQQLLEHQESHRTAELAAGSCLSGPHKDDFQTELNALSARQFASQGQVRTAVLAIKLAERELHRNDIGHWPVLLLDDVLSELDTKRQNFILEHINDGQVFISGCAFPDDTDATILRLQNGRIINP